MNITHIYIYICKSSKKSWKEQAKETKTNLFLNNPLPPPKNKIQNSI